MSFHRIYDTREYKNFRTDFLNGLLKHQIDALKVMSKQDRLTICMPTGTGKSRIIYADMLDNLERPEYETFVLASHRLLLNTQHFSELINLLETILPKLGIILVGSQGIDIQDLQKNAQLNSRLAEQQLNYSDIISTGLSKRQIKEKVEHHHECGRDVIIITTYHSMDKLEDVDIHTLYCDEAHMLATPRDLSQFKNNFEKVKALRKYFFSATPKNQNDGLLTDEEKKDVDNRVDIFLMDNEEIFGHRYGLPFKHAIDECLIVKPYVHVMELKKFKLQKNYLSYENFAYVVHSALEQHTKTLKDTSQCNAKILIKCPSVDDVWGIWEELMKSDPKFKVFAGANYSRPGMESSFYMNDQPIKDKVSFLKNLQSLKADERAVILHYDILSEGIDVPGITGVMFLSAQLPGKPKILQTIGRSTRLLSIDRERVRSHEIAKNDYDKMIKPNCAVILPVLSQEMNSQAKHITGLIVALRDEGFKPEVIITPGEDTSSNAKEVINMEELNKLDKKKVKSETAKEIIHYIELYDQQKIIEVENGMITKNQPTLSY